MKYVLWVVAVPVSCRLDRCCLQVKRMKLLQLFTKETCVGQSGIGTSFFPCTSVFPCQYHSTIAPYSFIHLPPTLYNVFLPVLQFSPVSIIPPLLHTHSFIYHPRCIMFFSQYFSFPLSVSFHPCSIPIFIYTFRLPAPTADTWEHPQKQFSFRNPGSLVRKPFHFF